MRSAILWGAVAIHTIIATGRHIPFEAFANVSRLDYDVQVFPAIGADGPVSPTTRQPGDRPGDDEDTVISRAINPLPASANDELWTKYARKGNSLTCAMCGTDLGAGYQQDDKRVPPSAASIWNGNIWDNPTWYWWDSQFEKRWCDMEGFWPMANTLKPMGMSTKSSTNGGDIHCFCVRHNNEAIRPDPELPFIPMPVSAQFYKAEEKFYQATDAFYFFAMDTRAGVIFGINLKSAAEMARRRWGREPREDELPKLRKLSDLYWSYWAWQHLLDGSDITHLNAYIVHSVQNTQTAAIAARAVRGRGRDRYEPYPGQLFYVESAEGEALLGSPIGATIGYFLMQHKKQLGDKYVYAIRIVVSGNPSPLDNQDPDVIFYIMDVPPTKAIPDASDQDPPQGRPQSEAPAIPPSNHLALRGLPSPHVTEQILGPKNIVRVHTIMAY